MLSCKEVTDQLSADLDGELSVLARLSVRFHQFICRDCRQLATNMRALVASLEDRPPTLGEPEDVETIDDEYLERIMAALGRAQEKKNPEE